MDLLELLAISTLAVPNPAVPSFLFGLVTPSTLNPTTPSPIRQNITNQTIGFMNCKKIVRNARSKKSHQCRGTNATATAVTIPVSIYDGTLSGGGYA